MSSSIVIRDVREHELDSVLALNNAAGAAILPLDAARLRCFFETAEYFRVAERDGAMAGFLVAFGSDIPHDSANFRWFRERNPEFLYIDRIVVASRRRGGGVGRAFYADVQSYAELRYPLLSSAGIYAATFLDAGILADCFDDADTSQRIGCWRDAFPSDDPLAKLRFSTGLGLPYLLVDQIPILLDYAILLNRRPGEGFSQLHFNVGYTF